MIIDIQFILLTIFYIFAIIKFRTTRQMPILAGKRANLEWYLPTNDWSRNAL